MKRLLFSFTFAVLAVTGNAQRLTAQFGVLTDAEKNMTEYRPEPEAAAVVLFDIGDSYFYDTSEGYSIRFTRTRRVKILTKAGAEMATVSIPYYIQSATRQEKITTIEAYTYVLKDGLVYKKAVDPASIYEETINNRFKTKKFAFPDVQEGAIIEYKYVIESPFQFRLPDWEFQSKIPTLYSEYTVSMIPFYEYIFIAQGIAKFDYQNSEKSKKERVWGSVTEALGASRTGIKFNDLVHTYAMRNIPSFKDDPYITSSEDYIMKMDFQLAKVNQPTGGSENVITTWPALNKELMQQELFGKYINAASRASKKILDKELVLTDKMSEEMKVELIVKYVRTHYRWDESRGYLAAKPFKEFAEQRSGNWANINLFLAALLQTAGIKAEPVIISTRRNGKIRTDYPFAHYFDGVLVLVSGQRTFLVDGAEDLLAYDRIPIRYINEKGLVVSEDDKESVRWIGLEPRVQSVEDITLFFKLNPTAEKALVSGQVAATEYEAYQNKSFIENDSVQFRKYLEETHQVEPTSVRFFNYDKTRLPYIMKFDGTTPVEKVGNKLVLQPLLNFPPKSNPFTQDSRSYPVDFIFARTHKLKAVITVPEGYKVSELPQASATDNDLGTVRLTATANDKTIEIVADWIRKKSVYPSSDYLRLKNLYTDAVKTLNAALVLEKM